MAQQSTVHDFKLTIGLKAYFNCSQLQFGLQNWKLWFSTFLKPIQITLISGPPMNFKKNNSSLTTVGVEQSRNSKQPYKLPKHRNHVVEIENIQDREHNLIIYLGICQHYQHVNSSGKKKNLQKLLTVYVRFDKLFYSGTYAQTIQTIKCR